MYDKRNSAVIVFSSFAEMIVYEEVPSLLLVHNAIINISKEKKYEIKMQPMLIYSV